MIIRIPALVALTEGGSVDLIGDDPVHAAAARYYGTADMVGAVRELADSLQVMADAFAALPLAERPTGRFPRTLGVNDLSLTWGGLFDLDGTCHHPHKSHRSGRVADIDVQRDPADDNLALAVYAIWQQQLNHRVGTNAKPPTTSTWNSDEPRGYTWPLRHAA